VVSEALK